MDAINIKPIGDVVCIEPGNWCSIADLSTAWVRRHDGIEEIMKTRICAAAIGIVWSPDNDLKVPVYDWRKGEIIAYGAAIQDILMRNRVTVSDIMMAGVAAFRSLQSLIPTVEEVEDTTDFSEATGGEKTLSL